MMWNSVDIDSLCLRPETVDPRKKPNDRFTYIDIAGIDREAKTIASTSPLLGSDAPSRARQKVQENDILVSTVRPNLNAVASVPAELDGEVASTGFCVLRPRLSLLDPRYLYYFVQSRPFIDSLLQHVRGANYPAVTDGNVKGVGLPYPALSEQRRIVEILDQADALRQQRRAADEKAKRILPALFQLIFGDPATNPKGWPVKKLHKEIDVIGGGTPSKANESFWRGEIPWASPKDMKSDVITDTEDHITSDAIASSAARVVPSGTTLIVYRSGILAHTFPVCLAGRDLAINQDLKALVPKNESLDEYIFGLFAAFPDMGLACVKRGATVHNVDGSRFLNLEIPVPPKELQTEFAKHLHEILRLKRTRIALRDNTETLFATLLHRAFTGDLTARWREARREQLEAELQEQLAALEQASSSSARGRQRRSAR